MAGRGYWKGFVSGVIFLAAVFIVTTISGSAAQNTGKTIDPVSYTHLDVYKRQGEDRSKNISAFAMNLGFPP